MKKHLFYVAKILLSAVTVPFWFLDIFVGGGFVVDINTGELVHKTVYYNMYSALHNFPYLRFITIAMAVLSVITNVIAWKFSNGKAIKIVANVSFSVAATLFLVLLLLASTIPLDY